MDKTITQALLDVGKALSSFPDLATVWCVSSLYYSLDQLLSVMGGGTEPHVVEMESETGCLTAGWLNANYFDNDPIGYGQLAYISDGLPIGGKIWDDPFSGDRTEKMVRWKIESFWIVLKTLLEL